VAFLKSFDDISAWYDPRFLLNRLVDVYFLADLIVQFFVGVRPLEGATVSKLSLVGDGFIKDHRHIAWRYFISGWVRVAGRSEIPSTLSAPWQQATLMFARRTRASQSSSSTC
jgi:hypothetical protein